MDNVLLVDVSLVRGFERGEGHFHSKWGVEASIETERGRAEACRGRGN